MCPAILLANTNTPAGVSPPGSLLSVLDSGQIVGYNDPNKTNPTRLVTGIQQQATQAMQSDSTSGVYNNFIPETSPQPTNYVAGTITNIAVNTSGIVTTVVCQCVNTFIAGQTVKFSGLTAVPALNGLSAVVTPTSLSGSAFHATLTGYNLPNQTSTAETGKATIQFFGKSAGLSLAPNN